MLCRLLTAKSRSAKEASHHPAFMVGYLTISQTRLSYPPCETMGLAKNVHIASG